MLAELLALFAAGALRLLPVPGLGRRATRARAFRYIGQARHIGKNVLTMPRAARPGRHGADHRRHRHARAACSPGTWSPSTACGTCCWSAAAAAAHDLVGAELAELGADVRGGGVRRRRPRRARASCSPADPADRRRARGRRARRRRDRVADPGAARRACCAPKADAAWHLHELTRELDLARSCCSPRPPATSARRAGQLRGGQRLPRRPRPAPARRGPARDVAGLGPVGGRQRHDRRTSAGATGPGSRAPAAPCPPSTDWRCSTRAVASGRAPPGAAAAATSPRCAGRRAGRCCVRCVTRPPRPRQAAGRATRLARWPTRGPTPRPARPGARQRRRGARPRRRRARSAPTRRSSDLGFDSLTAVELRNRLTAATGLRLPATWSSTTRPRPRSPRYLLERARSATAPRPCPHRSRRRRAGDDEPIVIVGMGCRLPGGVRSPEDLWQLVADGGDAIGAFPADRGWDLDALYDPDPDRAGTTYVARGRLRRTTRPSSTPRFFGISPARGPGHGPAAAAAAGDRWEAFERAGHRPGVAARQPRPACSSACHLATTASGVRRRPTGSRGTLLTGSASSVVSGRVAYTFGLEGPAVTVDTACSSSLVALHLAVAGAARGRVRRWRWPAASTVMATPEHLRRVQPAARARRRTAGARRSPTAPTAPAGPRASACSGGAALRRPPQRPPRCWPWSAARRSTRTARPTA